MRAALGMLLAVTAIASGSPAHAGHVNVITVDGSINPASSHHIQAAIARSEAEQAEALLIELDTPGGLLASTKDIVQAMLNAHVPVIVFVSPQGAWAASAGAFVTMAGHVAAMAPGTSIGAASPVSASGEGGSRDEEGARQDVGAEKAEKFTTAFIESIAQKRKRNVEWAAKAVREAEAITQEEALQIGVIDVVASNTDDLLEKLDGRVVEVEGGSRTLHLAGAPLHRIEMTLLERLFNTLADPNVAILLVMAGLAGLYMEFSHPGVVAPGVIGVVCLVLAGIAFQILPFSWVGLLMLLAGLGLVVAELFVTSFGALLAAGLVCMLLGGSMVFDVPQVSDLTISFWQVLVPVVAAFGVFAAGVLYVVGRAMLLRQTTGVDELIGATARAVTDLAPDGKVFVRGEYWSASSQGTVARGGRVEVIAVEGLRLRVRPTSESGTR